MMKKMLFMMMLICYAAAAQGQSMYDTALEEIEKNSTAIKAYLGLRDAEMIENATGITPDDPEVGFDYIWGRPGAAGNNINVSLSQSFDFPSVYTGRNKRTKLKNEATEFAFLNRRMEVLLTAKKLLIELVYYNALKEEYIRQTEYARAIIETQKKKDSSERCRNTDYSKSFLNLTNMEAELKRIEIERGRIHANLARLNGDIAIEFNASEFEDILLPAQFDEWFEIAESRHPLLQHLRTQIQERKQNIKVARAEHLPEITIGYSGSFVPGETERHQGLTVGLTIPIWEDRNKVKLAKAQALAAEYLAEDEAVRYYNKLKYQYRQALSLQESAGRYEKALENQDNSRILFESYRKGELSLLAYLLEVEYFLVSYEKYLKTEMDLALSVAELEAYDL